MDDKIIFKRKFIFRLKYYLFINNINIIIIENTKYNKKIVKILEKNIFCDRIIVGKIKLR